MRKLFGGFILFFLVSACLFAQINPGKSAWVSVKAAPIKASTWFFAGTRGNLQLGAEVSVLQVNGDWAEVRSISPSLTGWTRVSNLSSRLVAGTGTSASASEVALAGKGFSREVEDVYKSGGKVNYAEVDRMETFVVSTEELLAFMTEGRLTTGESR